MLHCTHKIDRKVIQIKDVGGKYQARPNPAQAYHAIYSLYMSHRYPLSASCSPPQPLPSNSYKFIAF